VTQTTSHVLANLTEWTFELKNVERSGGHRKVIWLATANGIASVNGRWGSAGAVLEAKILPNVRPSSANRLWLFASHNESFL